MPQWDDVEIVTLDQAKQHARITWDDEDDDLQMKLEDAHALCLDYIARPADAAWTATMLAWTADTAPRQVRSAILRQFKELERFRGDDDDAASSRVDGNDLPPRVKQLLKGFRTPALA